jgi:uncharacterized protein YecE (DUF72 family)
MSGGEFLVGTSSWTDKTLLETEWYPKDARKDPAKRLEFYASKFPVVEVDSTYYGLPSEKNAVLWSERSPAHFTFNVKAYSLITQHPAQVRALPKSVRELAPSKSSVYQRDLPAKAVDEIFEMFARALMPLHSAGKLGFVLCQFPEWFVPSKDNKAYVLRAAERLGDYRTAIEFRQRSWMDTPQHQEMTLSWLRDNNLPYVCVDMPQGFPSSLPPVVAATTDDLAVMRFHGHNDENWKRKGITVAERFDYLYSQDELEQWKPQLFELATRARRTHVMFNNCYRDNAVLNAQQMAELLSPYE